MKYNSVSFDQLKTFISNCINSRIKSLMKNIDHIKDGFYQNVGFTPHPSRKGSWYSSLVQGPLSISVAEMMRVTYVDSCVKDNFWKAVERMNNKQRSFLIKFITGLPKIPTKEHFRIN